MLTLAALPALGASLAIAVEDTAGRNRVEVAEVTAALRREATVMPGWGRSLSVELPDVDLTCARSAACLGDRAAALGVDALVLGRYDPERDDPLTLFCWRSGWPAVAIREVSPLYDVPLQVTARAALRQLLLDEDPATALDAARGIVTAREPTPEEPEPQPEEERAPAPEPPAPDPPAPEPPAPTAPPPRAVAPRPAPRTPPPVPATAPPQTVRAHVQGSFRHPCTPATDLGPGRYARRSMVIYPVKVPKSSGKEHPSYSNAGPGGARLSGEQDLVEAVATALWSVDYPMRRFDAWLARSDAPAAGETFPEETGSAEEREALRCTDAVVVPELVSWEIEKLKSKKSSSVGYAMKLVWVASIYQRQGGRLARTDRIEVRTPGPLDHAEDITQAARTSGVDQLTAMAPGGTRKVRSVEEHLRQAIGLLPAEQAAELEKVLTQGELAITRVASIARLPTLVPALGKGRHPAVAGLGWRTIEDRCYTDPPTDKKPRYAERKMECEVLNRSRQAIRQVQLATARVDEFRLFAPAEEGERPRLATTVLGREEDVRVGDGYWILDDERRLGYARVRRLGAGGEAGVTEPTTLQLVWGRSDRGRAPVAREHPLLGIELAGWAGLRPAERESVVVVGEEDQFEVDGATHALTGAFRFDVDLGRTLRWFDWYQTNRLELAFSDELTGTGLLFGAEKRFLVLPRIWLRAGASVGFVSWTVPTGDVTYDDDGDEVEVHATATDLAADLGTGAVLMVTPSILLRVDIDARLAGTADDFRVGGDEGGDLDTEDEDLEIVNSGGMFGVSAGWVF
jgi:hypothetical protein